MTNATKKKMVLLSSTGDKDVHTGWLAGFCFGLYEEMDGKCENVECYKQVHNIAIHCDFARKQPFYLYRKSDVWWCSDSHGKFGGYLKHTFPSSTIPKHKWMVHAGGSRWRTDENLKIETVQDPEAVKCSGVTVTARGKAATIQPDCLGEFISTEMMSAGRQVFFNQKTGKYLFIHPNNNTWMIQDKIDIELRYEIGKYMISGGACQMCPAHPMLEYSWTYRAKNTMLNGDITVHCHTHQYD